MCLNVLTADLGPADGHLDLTLGELIFTTGLDPGQREAVARDLLDQPTGPLTGPCGHDLTV